MRWLFAFFALLPIGLSAFNGMADIGVGAKSKGMGGVGIALPQDAFASAANPAGLVCVGSCIDVGVGYVWEDAGNLVYITDGGDEGAVVPSRTGESKTHGLWFPDVGIAWRYCGSQSVGLAAYVRGSMRSDYDTRLFDTIAPTLLDSYFIFLTPSWSWRIAPCVSVGVAVNGIIELHRNNFGYGGRSVAPNQSNGTFIGPNTLDVAGGANVRAGLLFSTCWGVSIGLTAQTPSLMSTLRDYSGQWPRKGLFDWPAELGVGAALNLCAGFLISVDWNYLFWSRTTTLGNSRLLADAIDAHAGSALGPGFGWEDQSVWKFGAEWTPACLPCITLRAGYNFGGLPIVPEEVFLNQVTLETVEHHVTAGASFRYCCFEITAYYFHGFRNTAFGRGRFYIATFPDPPGPATSNITKSQNGAGISCGVSW